MTNHNQSNIPPWRGLKTTTPIDQPTHDAVRRRRRRPWQATTCRHTTCRHTTSQPHNVPAHSGLPLHAGGRVTSAASKASRPARRPGTGRRRTWWTAIPIAAMIVLSGGDVPRPWRRGQALSSPNSSHLSVGSVTCAGCGGLLGMRCPPRRPRRMAAVTTVSPATLRSVGVPGGVDGADQGHGVAPAARRRRRQARDPLRGGRVLPLPRSATVGPDRRPCRSRFGTFSGLQTTHSSSTDVYANTPTLSFYRSTYTRLGPRLQPPWS